MAENDAIIRELIARLDKQDEVFGGRIKNVESKVDILEEKLEANGEHMAKIDLNYEVMRSDIAELKNDLKASYQESVNQIMAFFNENQRNEFELRKNQQTFIYKLVGTLVGSGGIVWLIVDFLIKK